MTDIKKQFIEQLLDNSIETTKEHLEKIGMGNIQIFDSIDRTVLVNELVEACMVTGEELLVVDAFLNSDAYKRFEKSLSIMADIVFKKGLSSVEKKTIN
jgi:hypothetical protein